MNHAAVATRPVRCAVWHFPSRHARPTVQSECIQTPTHSGFFKLDTKKNAPSPSARDLKNVMMLCDGCDTGWHLSCMQRTLLIRTKEWYCPDCAQDCEKCGETDVHDSCLKRLLQCVTCHAAWHMHCLSTPLAVEPTSVWRCGTCVSYGMTTRSAQSDTPVCAYCMGIIEEDDEEGQDYCRCSYCARNWHVKVPCLSATQRPATRKSNRKTKRQASMVPGEQSNSAPWRCPHCRSRIKR